MLIKRLMPLFAAMAMLMTGTVTHAGGIQIIELAANGGFESGDFAVGPSFQMAALRASRPTARLQAPIRPTSPLMDRLTVSSRMPISALV